MGITDIWRAQVDAFATRFQCIAFDTRGAGRSEKPLPRVAYGVKRHAKDLSAVLDALGVSRVVLIGHSMGGNTALETYALNPARVAGIVFVLGESSPAPALQTSILRAWPALCSWVLMYRARRLSAPEIVRK